MTLESELDIKQYAAQQCAARLDRVMYQTSRNRKAKRYPLPDDHVIAETAC